MKIIGMVIATEINSVLKQYRDRITEKKIRGFNIFDVTLKDKTLYIVQSGVGEIMAAAATQLLISHFKAKMIINYGVAGALTETLSTGNVLIVEKVVHYDMDLSAILNYEVGRYIGYEDVYIPTTMNYVDIIVKKFDKIQRAICASGDTFISKLEVKKTLQKKYNADICDMESAAVVLTCNQNNIPNIIIKCVSDSLSGGTSEFYNCEQKSSDIGMNIVNQIINIL